MNFIRSNFIWYWHIHMKILVTSKPKLKSIHNFVFFKTKNTTWVLSISINRCVYLSVNRNHLNHPIPQGFSSLLIKPYVKGVTHSQEVGWWRTWMVECVTLFRLLIPLLDFVVHMILHIGQASWISKENGSMGWLKVQFLKIFI